MNNELLEQQMWEYIDGTMNIEQRPVFEEQLSQDSVLHRSYKEVMMLHESIKDLPQVAVSADFSQKIMLATAPVVTTKSTTSFDIKWIAASTALLSLLTMALSLFGSATPATINGLAGLEQQLDMVFNNTNFSYLMVFAMIPVLIFLDRYLDVSKIKGSRMFVLSF